MKTRDHCNSNCEDEGKKTSRKTLIKYVGKNSSLQISMTSCEGKKIEL